MNENKPTEAQIQKVVGIINSVKDSVLSGWQKASQLTGKSDFLAVIEPGDKDVSILVLPREAGLAFLDEHGCDTKHPSLERLTEPARGHTLDAHAIWVVVLCDGTTHVTKLVHQPMSQAGSA